MRGFRAGVVNPGTPFGARVRSLLEEQRLPVIELKLFQSDVSEGASLTRFQDEVVVTQPLDADLLHQLDVLFVGGEDNDLLNRVSFEAAERGVLTLAHGALGLEGPVFASATDVVGLAPSTETPVVVPRMPSYLLGALLKQLGSSCPIVSASATVLVPAQESGDRGSEELHQQVVNLLNFKSPPVEVFREQLAFNLTLAGTPQRGAFLAEAVQSEAGSLAELTEQLTVQLVQAPVFHGYAVSVWVELEESLDAKRVLAALSGSALLDLSSTRGRHQTLPSPISVAESDKIHVAPPRRTHHPKPGVWLWAAADTTAYDAGNTALEIARTILTPSSEAKN